MKNPEEKKQELHENLKNLKAKNKVETEKLEKQARDDEKEIEELKDDLEKLDYKVWQEQANVKDLVFQSERN